jgi:hypothetical protein
MTPPRLGFPVETGPPQAELFMMSSWVRLRSYKHLSIYALLLSNF